MPFTIRLVFVNLATYSLLHLALGAITTLIAGRAVRMGERLRPHLAADALLALRLFPALGSTLIVALVCVPSYLSNEPDAPMERVGYGCMLVALVGVCMWAFSLARGARAATSSWNFARTCGQAGYKVQLPGAPATSCIVNGSAPLLAISGIIRQRVAVSRGVLQALTGEELEAALRHERAHWRAHDNLKRFVMLAVPGVLPFAAGTRSLECAWKKFAELAADDRAAAGDERRSCALAAALVRVARLAANTPESSLESCLLGQTHQLADRVDRLLNVVPRRPSVRRRSRWALVALLLMTGSVGVAAVRHANLYSVHEVLERLEHFVE